MTGMPVVWAWQVDDQAGRLRSDAATAVAAALDLSGPCDVALGPHLATLRGIRDECATAGRRGSAREVAVLISVAHRGPVRFVPTTDGEPEPPVAA